MTPATRIRALAAEHRAKQPKAKRNTRPQLVAAANRCRHQSARLLGWIRHDWYQWIQWRAFQLCSCGAYRYEFKGRWQRVKPSNGRAGAIEKARADTAEMCAEIVEGKDG